ncbi:anti-sigma-D factor RsdA-like protein [Nocardia bhagyanarayanae]|uniref:Anti-sigma-D factor RsdA-like protein n=1 Tax=Nocardia bhagyanarayanae TaxID=1215925 RepID=A0A543F4B0_9NOCA|nr:anti-sigma-D factor RsdA-like protein [Nocardia bhagyanarayanae]
MARDGERGRGDWKARRGSRNSGPYAGGTGDTGPVDIAAVRRDDALIDAIASDGPVQTDSAEEFQLAALLADWRAELITPPLPGDPDLDAVVAAVNQEIGARKVRVGAVNRGRLRLVGPIAGTAAALALVFGGVTAFSYSAEPGDPLWRVKEVVFSEQAQTTVVQRAGSELDQAERALAQNNPAQAKALLERASVNVDQVSDSGKKQDLQSEWQRLLTQLRGISPEAAAALEEAVTSTQPRPSGTTGSTPTTTQPAQGTTNTNQMVPPVPATTPPTTVAVEPSQLPTQPTRPPTTQQPPVTTVPNNTPPVEEPPTQSPPATQIPTTVVVPSADVGDPTQPTTRSPIVEDGPGTVIVPSLPGGLTPTS